MRYLQRSIKYFLTLCALYFAAIYCASFASYAIITPGDKFHALISTPRGIFLLVVMLLLASVYPYFGYMKRTIDGDLMKNREQIMRCCELQNLKFDHETEGRLTFISNNFMRRVMMLFEDHIKIVQGDDGKLVITGKRKIVAFLIYRLEGAISAAEGNTKE